MIKQGKRAGLHVLVALCAFVLALAGAIFAQSTPAQAEQSTAKLTIHFSSIDGDDLMDPVVIGDIAPGTTVEDALATIGKDVYSAFFEKGGYVDSTMLTRRSIMAYADEEYPYVAMWADKIFKSTIVDGDMDIYALMYKTIENPTATLDVAICGKQTETQPDNLITWDYDSQTNPPQFTADGEHYRIYEEEDTLPGYWVDKDDPSDPYQGTFVAGETYYAELYFDADFGYGFEPDVFAVNNAEVLDTYVEKSVAFICVSVSCVADHDWGEWTVVKEPQVGVAGLEQRVCACGEVDQRDIPPLEPVSLTIHFSSVDGDDLVDAIVIGNLEPGTTVEAALATIGKTYGYDGYFEEVDGYVDFGILTYLPMQALLSAEPASSPYEAMWGSMVDEEDQIVANTDVYAPVFKTIANPTATLDVALCGKETTTPGDPDYWYFDDQTNKPVYTVEDELYAPDPDDNNNYWIEKEKAEDEPVAPFQGTFEAGETYYAELYFSADFGYTFVGGEFTVHNAEILDSWGLLTVSFLKVSCVADHDWGEWTVVKEPQVGVEGLEQRVCKGNPEHIEQRAIAALDPDDPGKGGKQGGGQQGGGKQQGGDRRDGGQQQGDDRRDGGQQQGGNNGGQPGGNNGGGRDVGTPATGDASMLPAIMAAVSGVSALAGSALLRRRDD